MPSLLKRKVILACSERLSIPDRVNNPPRQSQSFLSFSFANKQPDFKAAPFCARDSQHCAPDEWVIFHAAILPHGVILSIVSNHVCEISNLARANGIERIALLFCAKLAFC